MIPPTQLLSGSALTPAIFCIVFTIRAASAVGLYSGDSLSMHGMSDGGGAYGASIGRPGTNSLGTALPNDLVTATSLSKRTMRRRLRPAPTVAQPAKEPDDPNKAGIRIDLTGKPK